MLPASTSLVSISEFLDSKLSISLRIFFSKSLWSTLCWSSFFSNSSNLLDWMSNSLFLSSICEKWFFREFGVKKKNLPQKLAVHFLWFFSGALRKAGDLNYSRHSSLYLCWTVFCWIPCWNLPGGRLSFFPSVCFWSLSYRLPVRISSAEFLFAGGFPSSLNSCFARRGTLSSELQLAISTKTKETSIKTGNSGRNCFPTFVYSVASFWYFVSRGKDEGLLASMILSTLLLLWKSGQFGFI